MMKKNASFVMHIVTRRLLDQCRSLSLLGRCSSCLCPITQEKQSGHPHRSKICVNASTKVAEFLPTLSSLGASCPLGSQIHSTDRSTLPTAIHHARYCCPDPPYRSQSLIEYTIRSASPIRIIDWPVGERIHNILSDQPY